MNDRRTPPILKERALLLLVGLFLFILVLCIVYHQTTLDKFRTHYKDKSYNDTHIFYLRKLEQSHSDVFVLGDSHIQGLHLQEHRDKSINLGIGGDRIASLSKRVDQYLAIRKPQLIIIEVGVNDLLNHTPIDQIEKNLDILLNRLRNIKHIAWLAVIPTTNQRLSHPQIANLNATIQSKCTNSPNCSYTPLPDELYNGNHLREDLHIGDGLHLNVAGYRILSRKLNNVLTNNFSLIGP